MLNFLSRRRMRAASASSSAFVGVEAIMANSGGICSKGAEEALEGAPMVMASAESGSAVGVIGCSFSAEARTGP